LGAQLAAKRFGFLHELLPGATRFAVLVNPISRIAETEVKDAQAAAAAADRELDILSAGTRGEIDLAFTSLVQKRTNGLLVGPHSFFLSRRAQLLTLVAHHGVPTIFAFREMAEAGGLMSYGASWADQHRQLGIYAGRILKGERPADLPVMQPSKFELVINVQTAKTLGIEIPPTLLALADEIIE
jgi:putative tryptophan/tyrosine transport system substrate-binding protein